MKPKYIIIHHSASPQTQTFASINAYHKAKWDFKSSLGYYAGYQYVITADGVVHQARKDDETGAHTLGYNQNSIGICVVGWYDDGHDKLPTPAQQKSLGDLLSKKMAEWSIPRENVDFHRDYAKKTCPGMHITQPWISTLIKDIPMDNLTEEMRAWAIKKGFKTINEWIKYGYEKNKDEDALKKLLDECKKDKDNIKSTYEGRIKLLEEDVVRLTNEKNECESINSGNAQEAKFIEAAKFAWQTLWKK